MSSQHCHVTVVEATIPEMQRAMQEKRVTSRGLVTQYLTRIGLYEKRINAAISINPRALEEADARDAERAKGPNQSRHLFQNARAGRRCRMKQATTGKCVPTEPGFDEAWQ